MIENLATELIAVISAAASSLVTYFFARRKNNAEAQSSELDNVQKAAAIWRELAEQLNVKIDKLISENAVLKHEIQSQKLAIRKLETMLNELGVKVDNDIIAHSNEQP
jgi:uncharacterized protein (DUF3084 family)